MTSKLEERIAWINASDYSKEWKEKQIAGAIRSAETIASCQGENGYGGNASHSESERYYPRHNPYDDPREALKWEATIDHS